MQRLRIIIYVGLTLAWVTFALWQYRDFRQQRDLIEESLRQQSRSIMTAMVGGMRSHRRLGRFFEDQLQGMLDELVKSDDVVLVAIRSSGGEAVLWAGDKASSQQASGGSTGPKGFPSYFRLVEQFQLSPSLDSQRGPGGGRGLGMGLGKGGRGHGSATHVGEVEQSIGEGAFGEGGSFSAELVLDRSRADELTVRVSWSHALAVIAAGLVALSIGLVWRGTMNLAEAKGRSRVYQAEARHLRELSQAAAGLAHETRNPLGLIRGWTQRLAETTVPEPERQEHSHAIIEECDRVTARINQFLAFARPCEPDIQRVDVAGLLDQLAMIMQPDLEAQQLELHSDVPPVLAHLQADYELLRQVVFNLLQNAVHFSPPESTVDVTVKHQGAKRAVLQVADRGPGVEDEAVESLFVPYYTTRPQGTGLGLAIVRHIATLHDWEVKYCRRAGGGAIFEIGNMHVAD